MSYWIIVVIFSGNILAAQTVNLPLTEEQCNEAVEIQRVDLEKESGMKVLSIKCAKRMYDLQLKFKE